MKYLVLFISLALTGCGVDLRNPVSLSSTSSGLTYAFVTSDPGNSLQSFEYNTTTGEMSLKDTESPNAAEGFAITSDRRCAYSTSDGSDVIEMYTFNTGNGELTNIGSVGVSSVSACGNDPFYAVVRPDDRFLYVSNWGCQLHKYSIASDCTLGSEQVVNLDPDNPAPIVFPSNTRFHVAVRVGANYEVRAYDTHPSTGVISITPQAWDTVVTAAGKPPIFDTSNNRLYISEWGTGIYVGTIGAGGVTTQVEVEPDIGCTDGVALASDGFMFGGSSCVAPPAPIVKFSVSGIDGSLTNLGSEELTGNTNFEPKFDPSQSFLWVRDSPGNQRLGRMKYTGAGNLDAVEWVNLTIQPTFLFFAPPK